MVDPVPDTLETLIAPGKRARLSPYVENAQFAVLLGEQPDDRRRADSARQILGRHDSRVRAIAQAWVRSFESRSRFSRDSYTDSEFLDVYLAYYFSTNVAKIQLVLLELVRAGMLRGTLDLVDVGVGTGTTAVAALDFLLAWGQVCDLYGQPMPVEEVRIVGVDRSPLCLHQAGRVVAEYAGTLARRLATRENGDRDILSRVQAWASAVEWRQHDLNAAALTNDGAPPNLVVAANVREELSPAGLANLDGLLRQLPEGGLAIVVEPGDNRAATDLMRWRRAFVNGSDGVFAVAPCGQEHGNHLPQNCDGCWNLRRESFHQSPLYLAFRQRCDELKPDPRSFDEFRNYLLKWSHVVLRRATSDGVAPLPRRLSVQDGQILKETLSLRYIGTYHKAEPVAYHPDDFRAKRSGNSWEEYLKVCPTPLGLPKLAIRRRPGYQVPPLRFGQRFEISGVKAVQWQDGVFVLDPLPGDQTSISLSGQADLTHSFLGRYDATTARAVDELAFRLFGFPAMRDFQHQILARSFTGQSILGIAATGGGKSECFILPAMLLPGITIVVSPLKSLMFDQYEQRIKERYGLDHLATVINGDVPFAEREARLRRLELGYYKLVYLTPEQMEQAYVLNHLRRAHQRVGIRYLAMDEAHCISQWGHDFRSSYLNILRRLKEDQRPLDPVIIALTATASPRVRDDVC